LSEATAKATRRQLRRVVGETAGAALVEQSQLVARHDRLLGQHSSAIHATDASLDEVKNHLAHRSSELTWFLGMTCRERLVWVVTGRLPWA
jgi:hypothetical protein